MACSSVWVGYSRSAHTQRNVLPQMKWSGSNLTTEGAIISRKDLILAVSRLCGAAFFTFFAK